MPVLFYRSASGSEPVRDWLRALPAEDRQKIGRDLALVQYGWPVGMPLCRALGDGRSSLPNRRIARVLFFVRDGRIGFVKKTRRTPPDDLALARHPMQEMLS